MQEIARVSWVFEKIELMDTVPGNMNWCGHSRNSTEISQMNQH